MMELRVMLEVEPPVPVGVLAQDDSGRVFFEFDPAFIETGMSISPYAFPPKSGLIEHPRSVGVPIPGVFSDSRPDGWGLRLLHRKFADSGRPRNEISALQELAYLGRRTMGALSYAPTTGPDALFEAVELGSLASESLKVYQGTTTETLPLLLRAGGSPGGVRPKALIGRRADQVCIGDADLPDGWEHWMVKFERPEDDPDCAHREAAWMELAQSAGLDIADFEVLELGDDSRNAFATRRFDRRGGQRMHMLSAAGALNVDFRRSVGDYHQLGRLCSLICEGDQRQVAALVRLAMFNVVARNEDDHLKNLAWLYDGTAWRLSPAYDLTFAPHPSGHRQTSVMNESKNITRQTLLNLATRLGLSKRDAKVMLAQVLDAASTVQSLLANRGCTSQVSKRASAQTLAQVKRLGPREGRTPTA